MSVYVVYNFNVCGSEPGDAMEDVSFVDVKRVFSSLESANRYANCLVSRNKDSDDYVFVEDGDGSDNFKTVYYLSSEILDSVPDFDSFHGMVVVVREVDFDKSDDSSDDDENDDENDENDDENDDDSDENDDD